ncbi:MAG: hypothetical protein K5765_00295 [Clostridia bacterium]|nr:hypothetical protein [Clostridia bacterium]
MIERIKQLLKNVDITDYRIIESKTNSIELFYVLDKLETNRCVDSVTYSLTLYKDFGDTVGDATVAISPLLSDEDILEKLNDAAQRTELSKNKKYTLPQGNTICFEANSPILKEDKKEIALNVANAIYKANRYKEGWINSVEIFVKEIDSHLVNSKGADNKTKRGELFIEIIPTWKGEKEEVEIYYSLKTAKIDYERITKDVDELLNNAKARSIAQKPPVDLKNINVIFGPEMISEITGYLKSNLSYESHHLNSNVLSLDEDLSKDNDCKLNLTLKPVIDELSDSSPVDLDGIHLQEVKIIEEGICKKLNGSSRFGQYMSVENPTGNIGLMQLQEGNLTYEELTKEPYIYCVTFSSPQLDDYSGYYGGEVRLGYYFDGKNTIPVTGFSISGNLKEDFTKIKLSKEVDTFINYKGPKYLLVPNMTIN